MARLNEAHLRLLHSCVHDIYARRNPDEFPQEVLAIIGRLIPSECIAYNEFLARRHELVRSVTVGHVFSAPEIAAFLRNMHEHALIRHNQTRGNMPATRMSDLIAPQRFHRTNLYVEFFRPMRLHYQMATGVTAGIETVLGIALSRERKNFTETERLLLDLLWPHVRQAHHNALECAALEERRERAMDFFKSHAALIRLTQHGTILHQTEKADRLLRDYFPLRRSARQLPAEVLAWIGYEKDALGFSPGIPASPPPPCLPLVEHRSGRSLVIRLILEDDGRHLLMLRECSVEHCVAILVRWGLTCRQAQVLAWLAHGKTDHEVGILLKLSPRTVEKHIEHIVERLGVETRLAAILRAIELAD